jgi:nucleoside-diphosphate-sugar epimerase
VEVTVLIGSEGPLGRRVNDLLALDPEVDAIIRLTADDLEQGHREPGSLKARMEGASTLVHLGRVDGVAELDGTGTAGVDVVGTRALLEAAASVGVGRIVLLSSATVYGAWPNNPVPLTEDAALRPHPALAYATHKAEVERLAAEWRDQHPAVSVAVLRPVVAVAEDTTDWLANSLWAGTSFAPGDADTPVQFVHLDDLASAVDLARREGLDGPFNVAPDGWIRSDELRRLAGRGPRVRLPERVSHRLAAWRWKLGLTSTPPGVIAYRINPWVVANDRLRAAGWDPDHTNEEAYVLGDRPSGWASVSPRRRQELVLGGSAVGIAALVGGAVFLIRRQLRNGGSSTS